MKYFRIPLIAVLALVFASGAKLTTPISNAQGQSTALERGYRTGYSDGYSAGSRDVADKGARDYRTTGDYQRADRNYNEAWGTIEDYRDGYQQGFEAGYNAGYDRREFASTIPSGLSRRGAVGPATVNNDPDATIQRPTQNVPDNGPTQNVPDNGNVAAPVSTGSAPNGPFVISRDTVLLVELQSSLSTDATQRGDRFQARVIEPREFSGAIIDGRVTRVKRAGKVKGTAELQLAFEAIHLPDGRTAGFNAEVIDIVDTGRDDSGTVDSEGGVRGKSSTKDDISKVGASTGIGALIGAVIGGGKGAAIGAAIGGAASTGSVLSKRGEDVRLSSGQQLKIRTASETRIQNNFQ
jgi:hypothetical protein